MRARDAFWQVDDENCGAALNHPVNWTSTPKGKDFDLCPRQSMRIKDFGLHVYFASRLGLENDVIHLISG